MYNNQTKVFVIVLFLFVALIFGSQLSNPNKKPASAIGAKTFTGGGGGGGTIPCDSETDGGNFTDIFGRVMWGGMTQGTDRCSGDGSFVKEYFCKNSQLHTTGWVDCRNIDKVCKNGACTSCVNEGNTCCSPPVIPGCGGGVGTHYNNFDGTCFENNECWDSCSGAPTSCTACGKECCPPGDGVGVYW